ncbi:MAG: hypothetical protein Tsb0020_12960 [Haliangiales bacterium]
MALGACGGGDGGVPPPNSNLPDAGPGSPDATPEPPEGAYAFAVKVENVSDQSLLPSSLSPGFWALHGPSEVLFRAGAADPGQGLEALAEDGDPSALMATDLGFAQRGVFAEAASGDAASFGPGDAFEFTFATDESDQVLSLATMFMASNDVFLAPAEGIPLFADGAPIAGERDVSALFRLWDLGTEANQAPGSGPNQPLYQAASADTGAAEGVVRQFSDSTRALPLAQAVARASVSEAEGTYTITLINTSKQHRTVFTPISRLFYALHDDRYVLFQEGVVNDGRGLQALAEDGDPAVLVSNLATANGVELVGATLAGVPIDPPGNQVSFSVTPTAAGPRLTFAGMIVESNDAFLSSPPAGVVLLGEDGEPRPAADVEADINRWMAIWDAGTEENEAPGVGPHQAPRQTGADPGPVDTNTAVRRYADAGNDLAPERLLELIDISVTESSADALSFDVTVSNISDGSLFPTPFSPPLWLIHNGDLTLFNPGAPPLVVLERLAEDGNPDELDRLLSFAPDGLANGVEAADGDGDDALAPGESVTFTVTPDADHGTFNLLAMVVQSNDTFLALGPTGVSLLDDEGARRPAADVNDAIKAALTAWDAGTETNQAGAAGGDQALRQANPNTGVKGPNLGASEGDGMVREASEEPVWLYPSAEQVIRVTVRPVE